MKNISAPQVLFAALFVIKMTMPFQAAAGQRVGAVIYNNKLIPAVELKEVEISASRPATLCTVKTYKGDLIPSIEMNEVTISASGNYKTEVEGIKKISFQGIRTGVVAWRGSHIPHVEGKEVMITGDRSPVAIYTPDAPVISAEPIFQVSVRQAFDRVSGFLLDQGKEMLRKLVNSY